MLRPVPGVHRNLLIRFANDSIDETPALATMLQANSSISAQLDLTASSPPNPLTSHLTSFWDCYLAALLHYAPLSSCSGLVKAYSACKALAAQFPA